MVDVASYLYALRDVVDSYSCINLGMEMVVSGGDVRIIRAVFVSFVPLMSSILLLEREGKRQL
jgi:hypothetical protein